jgi:hypothetical protein
MDTSAAVTLLGGLGLFLLGIHHLTEGLKGLAGDRSAARSNGLSLAGSAQLPLVCSSRR